MRMKFIIYILVLLFAFWFFHLRHERERYLIGRGKIIVEKIEEFRTTHGRLPNSLKEIGEEEIDEGSYALWYVIGSEYDYMLTFGISFDDNKYYYSDTKTWEVGRRLMRSETKWWEE